MNIPSRRTKTRVRIKTADLSDSDDCSAICNLINMYRQDAMGGNLKYLSKNQQKQLIHELRTFPNCRIFLAVSELTPVGLAVCFHMFSTFSVKSLINIHDLIVHPHFRKQGIGKTIMDEIETFAKHNNCCRITLEVRNDNRRAQNLYRKKGYGNCDPPMLFWTKNV
ncbi:MAG: GNAT family N-acetyltransferase [Chitinispirillaceae bacterium]